MSQLGQNHNSKTASINIQLGFQNPVFADSDSINLENGYIDRRENEAVIDRIEKGSLSVDQAENEMKRLKYYRANSLLTDEVDIQFCNKIYTIKKRSYVNFKKSIQMLKPFLVLFVMIFLLIIVFRVDLFISMNENNPDDE
jgi:hypothetical protein